MAIVSSEGFSSGVANFSISVLSAPPSCSERGSDDVDEAKEDEEDGLEAHCESALLSGRVDAVSRPGFEACRSYCLWTC